MSSTLQSVHPALPSALSSSRPKPASQDQREAQTATPSRAVVLEVPPESEIPVVDFAGFLDGSAKEAVAGALLDSFKRYGFVYLKNYGVPVAEVDEMFEWVSAPLGPPSAR